MIQHLSTAEAVLDAIEWYRAEENPRRAQVMFCQDEKPLRIIDAIPQIVVVLNLRLTS